MKRTMSLLFSLILIAVMVFPTQAANTSELIKYPEYPEQYLSRDYAYSVSVTQGANSIDIPVYNAARQYDNFRNAAKGDYYRRFCEFAFSGDPVTVKVCVNIDMTCCEVLPSAKDFPSTINGNEISITLTKPDNVVVRLNDDINTVLTIFAEAPENAADIPTKGAENVIYCDAGIDNITGGEIIDGEITMTEGQTLYIAPGALVRARLIITGSNTTVTGKGALIDPETTRVKYQDKGSYMLKVTADSSKNAVSNLKVTGIKLLDSRSFNIVLKNVKDSVISDVKVFSNQVSTDGISLFNYVQNVTVQDSYFYVNDNVFVFGGWGQSNNTFKNLTIGSGYALIFPQGICNSITFEDLYVFHIRAFYKSTMAISNASTVQNIYAKNIYASDVQDLKSFINCVNQNSAAKTVTFENVALPAKGDRTITFGSTAGETYPTSNYTFIIKNLWFGTEQLTSLSTDYIQYADFVFDEASDPDAATAGWSTMTDAANTAEKIYIGSCLLDNFAALPQKVGDTMYVDALGVLKNLGYKVNFADDGSFTFEDKYTLYTATPNELTAYKNSLEKQLTNPFVYVNGELMMPITAFGDLGLTKCNYDETEKAVQIKNVSYGENLLINSDFEDGATFEWGTFEFAELRESDNAYSGEKSMSIAPCIWSSGSVNNNDYGMVQYVKDIMDKNGAGKYHLEAMVKLNTDYDRLEVTDNTVRMGFTPGATYFTTSKDTTLGRTLHDVFEISGEWQKIEFDIDITDAFLKKYTNLYLFIGSKKTEKKSIFVDDVKLVKQADDEAYCVDANMRNGAAIRLSSDNGIRFYTLLDSAKIAKLQADGATVELGTLISPKDVLGENDLTFALDSAKYINVLYEAMDDGAYYWHKDVDGQIAGSIVNILESNTSFSAQNGNVARDFVGRGYVKVTKDGKTVITYANYYDNDITNNTRSLAFVANALKNDTAKYNQHSDEIRALVDKWASKLSAK